MGACVGMLVKKLHRSSCFLTLFTSTLIRKEIVMLMYFN